jgi:hypothetical protein
MPRAAPPDPVDRRPGWAARLVRDARGLTAKARLAGFALATYADQATGEAWPKLSTLAEGAGLSKRSAQRALIELERRGLVRSVARLQYSKRLAFQSGHLGGHCEPAQSGHHAATVNPPRVDQAVSTVKPPRVDRAGRQSGQGGSSRVDRAGATRTNKGTSKEDTSLAASDAPTGSAANPFPRPDGVDPQHWADFLTNRRRKRLANTPTAHKRLMLDLARLADDDWPPGRLIEHAAAKGWGGIYDPRGDRDRNNGQHPGHRNGHAGGTSLVDLIFQAAADEAAEAEQAQRDDPSADPGTGLALSSH